MKTKTHFALNYSFCDSNTIEFHKSKFTKFLFYLNNKSFLKTHKTNCKMCNFFMKSEKLKLFGKVCLFSE